MSLWREEPLDEPEGGSGRRGVLGDVHVPLRTMAAPPQGLLTAVRVSGSGLRHG